MVSLFIKELSKKEKNRYKFLCFVFFKIILKLNFKLNRSNIEQKFETMFYIFQGSNFHEETHQMHNKSLA